jgi:hypothetical protein
LEKDFWLVAFVSLFIGNTAAGALAVKNGAQGGVAGLLLLCNRARSCCNAGNNTSTRMSLVLISGPSGREVSRHGNGCRRRNVAAMQKRNVRERRPIRQPRDSEVRRRIRPACCLAGGVTVYSV